MRKQEKSKSNFRTKAPFGVSTKRFEALGIHPNLDVTGSSKKNKIPLGPGQYDPEPFECAYKKYNPTGSSWKRKLDVEEYSKNLGYRNAHILKERQFRRSQGGPGDYEISEQLFKRQSSSCMYNVGFGQGKRFWTAIKYNNPPPGTYGYADKPRKQFSTLPTFEWDGFIDRFKDPAPPWAKAPNRYDPKDRGSISAVLAKVVSKRGPYDCFTGPRDDSTIKNYFAPPKFKGPLNWFNTWPTELDNLLHHPGKQRYGRFLKEARFSRATLRHMLDDLTLCYRDPAGPSPCTYDVVGKYESLTEFKENMHPFNMAVRDVRPPIKWQIRPGVGRYTPAPPKCSKSKKESWVFKSKTGRTEYKAVEYNAF